MRIAKVAGRAMLLGADGSGLDIAKASNGKFPADIQQLYERWGEFRAWADGREGGDSPRRPRRWKDALRGYRVARRAGTLAMLCRDAGGGVRVS